MPIYKPVLNVYVIWHPDADDLCRPLANAIYTCLNRDPAKPFARGIGIPCYFRCVSEPGKDIPLKIDLNTAIHNVIFVLVEDNLVYYEKWANYIAASYTETQTGEGRHLLVPVALTGSAFNLHPDITETNYVRLFKDYKEAFKQKLLHEVIHILARILENRARPATSGIELSPLPIKLFISHTKRDDKALKLAVALKHQLDNTQVDRFFDSVDIASGHNFVDEIRGNIEQSALIAIRSDQYCESPWCRLEVMEAKRLNRPIIVIDAIQKYEDRSFPYLSNVPTIRFDLDANLESEESQKRLQTLVYFALLEVLRFIYIREHSDNLKAFHRLPQDALLLSRPPEERELRASQKNTHQYMQVIYPDPPLGYEENSDLQSYNIPFSTPTTFRGKHLKDLAIGISISEPDNNELQILGLSRAHLQNAMVEITRQCLAQGAELIYGGDLRPNGFTEILLELVRYHNDSQVKEFHRVVNFLAWPLWSTLDVAWAAQNKDAIKMEKVDAPADLHDAGLIKDLPRGSDISNISPYIWARCLTGMRESLIKRTQARIMLGGRSRLYKGKYPGLVEEALLTLQAGQPLFLLGGYGGVTRAIISALQGKKPEQLTADYQQTDKNYAVLMDDFNQRISGQQAVTPIDYEALTAMFAAMGVDSLNNGLDEQENQSLFVTTNIEEAIWLILSGLTRINEQKQE